MTRGLVLLATVLALAGCSILPGGGAAYQGSDAYVAGIRQYDNGNYSESARMLQKAIDQGLPWRDAVNAHKHLAFIHCASGRERSCREEFRKALALDPDMELAPGEAGHPAWGPVFRALKAHR